MLRNKTCRGECLSDLSISNGYLECHGQIMGSVEKETDAEKGAIFFPPRGCKIFLLVVAKQTSSWLQNVLSGALHLLSLPYGFIRAGA